MVLLYQLITYNITNRARISMKIINIKEWLQCKPEDRKALLQKAEVEMEKFITVWNLQEELSSFKEKLSPEKHWNIWETYENQLKVSAKIIRGNRSIGRMAKLYPEYKNKLELYVSLL